jgi:hypothetical protein
LTIRAIEGEKTIMLLLNSTSGFEPVVTLSTLSLAKNELNGLNITFAHTSFIWDVFSSFEDKGREKLLLMQYLH